MKKIPLLLFILLLIALVPICAWAQSNTTNKGTEFWTVWMDHIDGTNSNMSLYITGDINTSGTAAAVDGSFSIPFTVTASQVTVVTIPNSAFLGSEGTFNKGIHITSAQNIVVYAHIYANDRSGATLVLPVNAMGKDYYSINYKQQSPVYNGRSGVSAFCVIATEDSTTVQITPTATLTGGETANNTYTITLQKGQVYQGLATADLTGTHIKSVSTGSQSCKKIAVYSGSSWVYITCTPSLSSADNLFQQVYPTAAWGKNYITAPLYGRGYDVYRIIYSDPTANVQLNGVTIPVSSLVNNFYYEFSSTTPNVITSDKPIQVVQYAVTEKSTINCGTNSETVGDPEMIFITPIEQGLDHVTLYSTDKQTIQKSFINVIIPTSAASSFLIDGATPPTGFTPVPGNTAYSYNQIAVSFPATHNISASAPFNAIAYGFGQVESYGYAAGTDLKNLNEFIVLDNPATSVTGTAGCTGVPYKLQLSIPYQTTNISWDFKDGSTPYVDNSPVVKNTVVKGTQTLYVYEYPQPITFNSAGSYSVVATVFNPTSDDCGSNEQIELDYTISDAPGTAFNSPATACPGDAVAFTDQTNTKGVSTQTWAWDFGDATNSTANNPNTATTQNPTHSFSKPGNYTVTLTVTNQNGCSTAYQQSIHINALPVASFSLSAPDCATRNITFTDTSIPGEGTLTTWNWDFGDGSSSINTTNAAFTHTYAAAGTYTVVLAVTSSTGCTNTLSQTITIHPQPVADFVLPDICTSQSTAQFTDKSNIADNSQLTYLWNFGDPNATAANPNTSTLQNPTHNYSAAANYTVTLTVTSNNGCTAIKTAPFTVNGDNPTAAFHPDPANTYCSSDDVVIISDAKVSFGLITQIKMYWDYSGDQSNFTIYTKDQINAGGVFKMSHNYGLFNNPGQTKTYSLAMLAYSGSSAVCAGQSPTLQITIKTNPAVTLSNIGTICQEALPVQITENKNGFTGTGVFSGKGISPSGLFDPSVSGPGTFTINYVFTANNSCTYSASQTVTVYPTPTANAGPNLTLLEGGSKKIYATATGNTPLTYKWTPADGSKATGLDHDDVLQPVASPTDNISYVLTVISADGCTASSTMSFVVLKAPVVPNTFTPNNDGVNDTWDIKYLDSYPNCTVDIYNRYGEKLYSSIGYPIPWDGTYKGAQLPVGTYYYIINPKNGRSVIAGSVTIIR